MKHFSVVCVCVLSLLALLPPVFGLECYTTNLQALRQGTVEHHTANCLDSIKNDLQQLGQGAQLDDMLRCYKAVIHGARDVEVKGCVIKGSCGVMKETVKNLLGGAHMTADCYECQGNNCNTGNPGAKIATGALLLLAAMLLF